jgi:hypothetical protein
VGQEKSHNLLGIKENLKLQELLETVDRITSGLYRGRARKAREHQETLSCGS